MNRVTRLRITGNGECGGVYRVRVAREFPAWVLFALCGVILIGALAFWFQT